MYLRLSLIGPAGASRHDRLGLSEQFGSKALALDDSLADAHATIALIRLAKFDLQSAESHLERAIDLEPSRAVFHEWLARLYVVTRPAEALNEGQRALTLDPLSPSANAEFARALLANGRFDEALTQLQKVAALRPPLLRVAVFTAQCYMKKGMWPEAITLLRAKTGTGPTAIAHLGYALARTGQREEALRIRASLVERWQRGVGGEMEVALVSAGLGDLDEAFAWLDRAMDGGLLNPDDTLFLFGDLQRDPRFERIRVRLGLQNR
jgi:tetratricopeptide (TPR) repeat protein